jgi:hypothetical protein
MAADSTDCTTYPAVDAVIVVGPTCPDSPVPILAPLPLEPGVAPADDCWVTHMATKIRGATTRRVSSRPTLQHAQNVRPTANPREKAVKQEDA